ncbi:MAG: phosphate/phosphite/phosphonate ABC transporter substrate-binding protein [Magnetospirillum sp.]|nr:phosphate/phosphite/phosphonate ABC transporter substrate-binding protein [Magnetospirillum sp.]
MQAWPRLLSVFVVMVAVQPAFGGEAIRVLLLPFTNTASLMKVHQPIRLALQQQLNRPVELYTSADFSAHFQDIRRGDFDIAITGPHFGAWAVDHGHRPLLRYSPTLAPVLAVRKDGGLTEPTQLRGKLVALSNRLSTSSLGGEHWLSELGLVAGRDYRLLVSPTHTTAIMAVAKGEADAAITTHTPIQQAPPDIRDRLTVIVSPYAVPHLFTIANAAMPEEEAIRIKSALKAFQASEAGKAFFTETGYQGYADLGAADVQAMQPYITMLLQVIEAEKP